MTATGSSALASSSCCSSSLVCLLARYSTFLRPSLPGSLYDGDFDLLRELSEIVPRPKQVAVIARARESVILADPAGEPLGPILVAPIHRRVHDAQLLAPLDRPRRVDEHVIADMGPDAIRCARVVQHALLQPKSRAFFSDAVRYLVAELRRSEVHLLPL